MEENKTKCTGEKLSFDRLNPFKKEILINEEQINVRTMTETIETPESAKGRNRRVHMANERTFLAWIRTSIGIMAFGFVVEKFALFLNQMSIILGQTTPGSTMPPSHGYSAIIGIFLVGLGTLLVLLSFIRFKKVERQIDTDTFHTSSLLDTILTVSILAVGIFLVVYLIHST